MKKRLGVAGVTLAMLCSSACKDEGAASGGTGGAGSGATTASSSAGSGGGPSCTGTQSSDPEFAKALQVLRNAIALNAIPGGAIAVIKDGAIVNVGVSGTKQAGVCDPITPDTRFGFPYLSEILTGLAALDAVEDQKLSLSAPITEVIGPLKVDHGAEFASDITLHHLLTHTSTYTSAADAQPQQSTCTGLAEAFASAVNPIIEGTPGSLSDSEDRGNIELTALMLEVVDKKPFQDVIASRVLAPLGMGGTFDVAAVDAGDHAVGHSPDGNPAQKFECPNHYASYGYYDSINGIAKLGAYLGTGGPILDPSTFAAMHAEQGPAFYSDTFNTYLMTGWSDAPMGERFQTKSGGVSAGFSNYMMFFPDRGLVVVVVLNIEAAFDIALGAALDVAKIYGVNSGIDLWKDGEAYAPDPASLPSLVGTYEDGIGVNGTGPRTLLVSQQADPAGISATLSDMNGNTQSLSLSGNFCADNFDTSAGELLRFWRDPAGAPYAVQFFGYHNGPAFFRVP